MILSYPKSVERRIDTNKQKEIRIPKLIFNIAVPLIGGSVFGLLTKDGQQIFESLKKPPLTPQGAIFPFVWSALYILMGVSSYLISQSYSPRKKTAFILYGLNLFFNFLWTLIFFLSEKYLFAFIWIVLLFLLTVAMVIEYSKINKTAALLQLPYLLWLAFAGYLNFAIWFLN